MILTERTYVNSDRTRVAHEGSSDAAFLLGLPGDEVTDEEAQRLGLDKSKTDKPASKDKGAGGLHG